MIPNIKYAISYDRRIFIAKSINWREGNEASYRALKIPFNEEYER